MNNNAYIDGFIAILEKSGVDKGLIDFLKDDPSIAEQVVKQAQGVHSSTYSPLAQTSGWQDFKGLAKNTWDSTKYFAPPYLQYRALKDTNWLGAGNPWTLFKEPFTGAYKLEDKIKNKYLRWGAKGATGIADLLTYAIPGYNVGRVVAQGGQGIFDTGKALYNKDYPGAAANAATSALLLIPGGVGKYFSKGVSQGVRQGVSKGIGAGASALTSNLARANANFVPKSKVGKTLLGGLIGSGSAGIESQPQDLATKPLKDKLHRATV